jgi:hypothetical protein
MPVLFSARTSNGASSAVTWPGGIGTYYAGGTFGGATVTLEVSFDQGNSWLALGDAALTQQGAVNFQLPNVMLRAVVANATGTTSVTAIV